MRKLLITVLAVSLFAGLLSSAVSASVDDPAKRQESSRYAGCEGRWERANECSFRYGGGTLFVEAAVGQPVGAVSVMLETKNSQGARVVLAHCFTLGTCVGVNDQDELEKTLLGPAKGQRLFCTVEGVGGGTFACSSGTQPSQRDKQPASKTSEPREPRSGCEGRWESAAECDFVYRGGQLRASAFSKGQPLSGVTVSISVEGPVPGTRIELARCATVGSCSVVTSGNGIGDSLLGPAKGDKLFCTVEGIGAGRYACSAG